MIRRAVALLFAMAVGAGLAGATSSLGERAPAPRAAAIPPGPELCEGPPPVLTPGSRRPWSDPSSLRGLRSLARAVGAPGAELVGPCWEAAADDRSTCWRGALASFFRSLDATAAGGRAAVIVFGNSLIASDGITGMLRARLVERFGSAGRGLVLADRMAWYGPRHRTAQRASGWDTENIGLLTRPRTAPGITGVNHISDGGALASFDVRGETYADVFWHDLELAPDLWWRVDDGQWTPLGRVGAGPRMRRIPLGADAGRFELKALAGGAVVHGVALERESGGIVLDVFGVPSADADLWLDTDPRAFAAELEARDPRLVVIMLGGNEAKRIAWGMASRSDTEGSLERFLGRIHEAAPLASCLVVGPIDAVVGPVDAGDPFRQRPQLASVIDIERKVALAQGCAFFDLYRAMGGRDSLKRLADAGQVHDDLTHPRDRGLDMLGLLIADALLSAYASPDWAPERGARGVTSP